MTQATLFSATTIDADEDTSDSWCTPPEIMEIAHRLWPGGIDLDCCSNGSAISLGFVRARVAWRKADDCMAQPTWNVWEQGIGGGGGGMPGRDMTLCWGQPPYSREGAPIVEHFCTKVWDAGELWESLWLVRLDTSTRAWAMLEERSTSLVLFMDRLDHFENGTRRSGSNFCSAMHLFTRADPHERHRALEAAVDNMGWCYRRGEAPGSETTT